MAEKSKRGPKPAEPLSDLQVAWLGNRLAGLAERSALAAAATRMRARHDATSPGLGSIGDNQDTLNAIPLKDRGRAIAGGTVEDIADSNNMIFGLRWFDQDNEPPDALVSDSQRREIVDLAVKPFFQQAARDFYDRWHRRISPAPRAMYPLWHRYLDLIARLRADAE